MFEILILIFLLLNFDIRFDIREEKLIKSYQKLSAV